MQAGHKPLIPEGHPSRPYLWTHPSRPYLWTRRFPTLPSEPGRMYPATIYHLLSTR